LKLDDMTDGRRGMFRIRREAPETIVKGEPGRVQVMEGGRERPDTRPTDPAALPGPACACACRGERVSVPSVRG
jgi:hypothetical protein